MANRVRKVEIVDRVLTPNQAVLNVVVELDRIDPTTEIRGRFTGPHCRYASTVEVAYPLREQQASSQPRQTIARVVIPEPSLWEPESPFLYRGIVELWENGARRDRANLSHGLRLVSLGARGLRINGRKLTLRGCYLEQCDESAAMALRDRGVNLWIVPVQSRSLELWNLADRLGFLILGRVMAGGQELVASLDHRASSLGWIAASASGGVASRGLIGRTAEEPFGDPGAGCNFVVCPPCRVAAVVAAGLPFLVNGQPTQTLADDEVLFLGTVEKT